VPVLLDGSNGDAGWSPSVQVDAQGVAHVAYVNATFDNLDYVTDAQARPARSSTTATGSSVRQSRLPQSRKFHFVGDERARAAERGGPLVVYQDATTQELLLAQRQMNGMWTHTSIAGATQPWPGGYGFFAAAAPPRPTS